LYNLILFDALLKLISYKKNMLTKSYAFVYENNFKSLYLKDGSIFKTNNIIKLSAYVFLLVNRQFFMWFFHSIFRDHICLKAIV